MDRKQTLRVLFSSVTLTMVCLIFCGCRSTGSGRGLMGVSSLTDPVPSQWEPPVETLSASDIQELESTE